MSTSPASLIRPGGASFSALPVEIKRRICVLAHAQDNVFRSMAKDVHAKKEWKFLKDMRNRVRIKALWRVNREMHGLATEFVFEVRTRFP